MCNRCGNGSNGRRELGPEELNSAVLLSEVGVNILQLAPFVHEAFGDLMGLVLSGPFAAPFFEGRSDVQLQVVFAARPCDLGELIGRIRAAAEMHGMWEEVSRTADQVAAETRADWDVNELGGALPTAYQAPPGFDDSGSGQT